jgi:hypothetical protein
MNKHVGNIFPTGHMVQVFSSKDGKPLRSSKRKKRPAGMSGRQWKKFYKAKRKPANAIARGLKDGTMKIVKTAEGLKAVPAK